jgi:hypothetical protein
MYHSQQEDTEEDKEVEVEDVRYAKCKSKYDAEYTGPVVSMSAVAFP